MIGNIKRLPVPPKSRYKYPLYVRTANDRYFIKVKSPTEATWLEFIDSNKFKIRTTGFDECGEGEFFDVDFLITVCIPLTEQQYIGRIKDFISHFEFVKNSLNL